MKTNYKHNKNGISVIAMQFNFNTVEILFVKHSNKR